MSKAKFDAARELINERRFDEARAILKTIDHPKAKEWLEKLDKLQPPKAKRRGSVSVISLFIVLLVLVAVVIVKVVSDQQQSSLAAGATQDSSIGLVVSPSPLSTEIPTGTPQPTSPADIATRILGTWTRTDGGMILTFYSDGTGVFDGSTDITYQLQGEELTIDSNDGGDPLVYTIVSLTQDTLQLKRGGVIQLLHRT